eukprot:Phypoly_transcript_01834.p1 GENE.Phypoly_transcript_01834~~Phypoly_transcript_01834.p1  ORF type:complete len:743 (-),score=122.50 Phypoly_transcript_01834:185-2413(-)
MALMLASFPSSTEMYDISDQNQWWLGEKYDGVRCYWNPEDRQLYSRHGLSINFPQKVSLLFGHVVFDGEIWCGRGLFAESNSVAQASIEKVNWAGFRVVCFDEASKQMHKKPFERRYSLLLSHFTAEHPSVIIAPRFLCKNMRVLTKSLQQIVEGGGEGLILRKPRSVYFPGRSSLLLKIKASRGDQEALVLNVEEDGSLLLQVPSGATFIVPKDDCVLYRRPARGDVVSFTHEDPARSSASWHAGAQDTAAHLDVAAQAVERDVVQDTRARTEATINAGAQARATQSSETHETEHAAPAGVTIPEHDAATQDRVRVGAQDFARGVPAKPIVYRIRNDLSWGDVLLHYQRDANLQTENNTKKKRYSSHERKRVMRSQLESLARSYGLDPLVSENWYTVSRQALLQHKEIGPIISHYNSSLIQALIDLFPELNLQVDKFATTPHKFWENVNNRRDLFKKFAKSKGGDPLDSRFWLSVKPKMLRKFKGMKGVMAHYKGYYDAVLHLFPEIRLTRTEKFWTVEDRKTFFDNFAAAKGFDPLIPDNWYPVSYLSLSQHKGFKQILRFYDGDLSTCLMQLYPNIGLQKAKFGVDVQKQRQIFEKFAQTKNVDPQNPQFWYALNPKEFRKFQSMRDVVKYYGGYPESVMRLFPELTLKRNKFSQHVVQSWTSEKDRRRFFDQIAAKEGFDPLVAPNWYKFSFSKLSQYQGYKRILYHYYGGKLSLCLMQLYPNIGLQKAKFGKITKSS